MTSTITADPSPALLEQLEALIACWGTAPAGVGCVTCGKRCPSGRKARHVQISVMGEPLPLSLGDATEEQGSQGWFPVGSSCAKRWPDGYVSEPWTLAQG